MSKHTTWDNKDVFLIVWRPLSESIAIQLLTNSGRKPTHLLCELYIKVGITVCCLVNRGVAEQNTCKLLLKWSYSTQHAICICCKKSGNVTCSPDKAEIQLFEVRIRGVGLYQVPHIGKNMPIPSLFFTTRQVHKINTSGKHLCSRTNMSVQIPMSALWLAACQSWTYHVWNYFQYNYTFVKHFCYGLPLLRR